MANEPGRPDNKNRDTLVVDLGTKKQKQIKDLRKGKGKLMEKVNECLNELKASGALLDLSARRHRGQKKSPSAKGCWT